MLNNKFIFILKKSALFFLILTFSNSDSYSEGSEESVSALIRDKARNTIEIHLIQKLSETPVVSSDFSVVWKNFENSLYSEKELSLKQESFSHKVKDNILFLKLLQPAPLTGLITITYNSKIGKLKKANGEKVRNFTCIVQNRTGIITDWENIAERYWLGRNFWGNRLQDWRIRAGRLECLEAGPNK